MPLEKIKNLTLDCLFPIYCFGCGKFLKSELKTYLCDECYNKIPLYSGLFCPLCFKRLAEGNLKKCQHSDKKSHLDFLAVAADYENPAIKELIHRYKYNFAKEIKWTLAKILIDYLRKSLPFNLTEYHLLAIPLFSRRFNWRGFNQSQEIAKILSQSLKMPLLDNCLVRHKRTTSQAELKDFEKRKLNVQNAFSLKDSLSIKNKNIVLLDDVYTSGATLEEAAKVLKNNGAKRIIGLVIAR